MSSEHWVNAIFGVIRTSVLRKARPLHGYAGADYPLLGELALFGKFFEIEDVLFLRRIHSAASSQNVGNAKWLAHFWTGATKNSLPAWNRSLDEFYIILGSELALAHKISLLVSLGRIMISRRQRLRTELKRFFK